MHTHGHALWPAVRLAGLCGFDCQGTMRFSTHLPPRQQTRGHVPTRMNVAGLAL